MKQIVCEMCGGSDLVKEGDLYICQHCGSKYTVEAAKKLMVEVTIDNTERLANLYTLARRASDSGDSTNAKRYYSEILQIAPDDWEATLFSAYHTCVDCIVANLGPSITRFGNQIPTVCALIKKIPVSEQGDAIGKLVLLVMNLKVNVAQTCTSYCKGKSPDYINEFTHKHSYPASELANQTADAIIKTFGLGEEIKSVVSIIYKSVAESGSTFASYSSISHAKTILAEIDPTYIPTSSYSSASNSSASNSSASYSSTSSSSTSSSGCYVATAVYGSYDCPEVWTLRRYRDYDLAKSWYGRLFIKTYYAVSPTIVKWFGDTEWFKNMWRGKLDRMVSDLKSKGYEDTPYEDRDWR